MQSNTQVLNNSREPEGSARIPARRLRAADRILDRRRREPLAAITRQNVRNYRGASEPSLKFSASSLWLNP